VHPFEKYFGLVSHPTLDLEFQEFSPAAAFGLNFEEAEYQIRGLLDLSDRDIGDGTLELVLQPDVLRFVGEFSGTQSEE
jgi:hypothetical protein